MEAMILAAGIGTRLRPLTDRTPKALIPVGGRPLLAHVVDRVVAAGATRIVINTHHHAEQVQAFLEANTPPGVQIVLSPEPDGPYDTGGGLLAAAHVFDRSDALLLHNVDVLSAIPLDALLRAHAAAREAAAGRLMASLAVQDRNGSRKLLFDAQGLVGWENRGRDGALQDSRTAREPVGELRRWSFTGIHVVEPAMLGLAERRGTFSIIAWYLDLVAAGYRIQPIDVTDHAWLDVGTHGRLAEAEARFGRAGGSADRP